MKKLLLMSMLLSAILLTGCNDKKVDYEAIMKAYADTYFMTYAEPYLKQTSSNGKQVFMMDIYEVTVGNIRNVNATAGGTFDLSKIKDCSSSSRVDLLIDRETSTVSQYEYYLDCEQ